MDELRTACAAVARRGRSVRIEHATIPAYAADVCRLRRAYDNADGPPPAIDRESTVAFELTLDAINFGSGWFPTLRKRDGRSGYHTIALGWREHHDAHGPFTAPQLTALRAADVAAITHQDPAHELMALYAASLNDLGARLHAGHAGSFSALVDSAGGSAVTLARTLGGWPCFADVSDYDGRRVPFLKRAQIAAADLHRAGAARFADLDRLTLFADNLVPHVLRLDGILSFDPALVTRIDAGELIVHGAPEEIEIRACALHAVELLVAQLRARDPAAGWTAAGLDELLWSRGQQPRYKAQPRHRSRCTAY